MRAKDFISEEIVNTISVGNLIVDIDQHIIDQRHTRALFYPMILRVTQRLAKIQDVIMQIEPGQKFWVYSAALDTAIGLRKSGQLNKVRLMTAVGNRPWESDVPIIDIDNNVKNTQPTHDAEAEMVEEMLQEIGLDANALPLFESEDSSILQDFFKLYTQPAEIGKKFFVTTVLWADQLELDKPIIKFNLYRNAGIVKKINDDHLIIDINNKSQRFPEVAGHLPKITATLLFNSTNEQTQAQSVFDLKFSEPWRLVKLQK